MRRNGARPRQEAGGSTRGRLATPPRGAEAGEAVKDEVAQGGGAARCDDAVPLARAHQHTLAPEPSTEAAASEGLEVAPVGGRVLVVEEVRLAQEHRVRADGTEHGAAGMPLVGVDHSCPKRSDPV